MSGVADVYQRLRNRNDTAPPEQMNEATARLRINRLLDEAGCQLTTD